MVSKVNSRILKAYLEAKMPQNVKKKKTTFPSIITKNKQSFSSWFMVQGVQGFKSIVEEVSLKIAQSTGGVSEKFPENYLQLIQQTYQIFFYF